MEGCQGRRFEQVIPFEALGKLDDDMTGFDPDDRDTSSDGFLVIKTEAGRTVFQRNPDGSLYLATISEFAGLDQIAEKAYAARGAPPPWVKEQKAKVPWPRFLMACHHAMDRWAPDMRQSPLSTTISGMANFLAGVNGAPVPCRYNDLVFWIAFYHVQVGEKRRFLTKIREVHSNLMNNPPGETEPQ
jgi:hypothetical protein